MLYGDDSRVYASTFMDYITDGKIKLADGTEKNMNELTFVMEATHSAGSVRSLDGSLFGICQKRN